MMQIGVVKISVAINWSENGLYTVEGEKFRSGSGSVPDADLLRT